MKMGTYNLYQKIELRDKTKFEYELIGAIDVCISITNINNVQGDILYTVKNIIGLTKYKDIDEKLTYKLVDGLIEDKPKMFDVKGIVFGRFTQLILKEVIK